MRRTPTGLMLSTGASIMPWLMRGGFFIAVLGGAYLLLKNIILTIRRNNDLSKVGTNTPEGHAIGFASRCYAAIIPSGHPWLNDTTGDGTSLEELYQVAREMHSTNIGFAQVSAKYKSLYSRDLFADLSGDLNNEELNKFNGLLSTGLGGPVELMPLHTHHLVTKVMTPSYDEQLQGLQWVPANVLLGFHAETMMTAGLGNFHGFEHTDVQGQTHMRFVPADDVAFLPASN